jgi:hypothetical protein
VAGAAIDATLPTSSCSGLRLNTSITGSFSTCPASRIFSKSVLSSMRSRITSPTTIRAALERKAIGQPHEAKASCGIRAARTRKASWESRMPEGSPSCGKQP